MTRKRRKSPKKTSSIMDSVMRTLAFQSRYGTIASVAAGAVQGIVQGTQNNDASRRQTMERLALMRDGLVRIQALAAGDEPRKADKIAALSAEVEKVVTTWWDEVAKEQRRIDEAREAAVPDPADEQEMRSRS